MTDTGTLTTVALALIAAFAVLTVIGILWGARLKRQRAAAERIEAQNAERERQLARTRPVAVDPPAKPADEAPIAPPPPPPPPPPVPVAPPPPPLAPEPPVIADRATDEPAALDAMPLADVPIAAAAPLDAAPATEAASTPEPPAAPDGPAAADGPITQLKGLGPKLAERLAALGITTVGQLAALDTAEAEALDARLGPFTGRMNRDRWIEQARFLAAGDRAGFEAVFGRL
ncbi:hypothetical protein ACM61V_07240 [Sphingomonas sp. TX0543]|uniref:hypothetical protein n=1 Tax=Sphingomonas sp. TX0543 TaxID=3399682 RepID=UPI003AFB6B4A